MATTEQVVEYGSMAEVHGSASNAEVEPASPSAEAERGRRQSTSRVAAPLRD